MEASAHGWGRMRQLFEQALERDPSARDAFLENACADDPGLRRRITSLLGQDLRPGDPIAETVLEMVRRAVTEAQRPRLAPGEAAGRYSIRRVLGRGGMGEVYEAEDTELRRKVALKVLAGRLAPASEQLERFQREARALAALSHPNIVTIYSIEHQGDLCFLVMELAEGEPLTQVVSEHGLALAEFFDIAIPLAWALAAAHEKGIVHRDLKPANVIVGDDRKVKILDFGLAKLCRDTTTADETGPVNAELTGNGMVMGTMPYMSPEQVKGRALGPRSDLFSLGVILYELATGSRPFHGGCSAALISSILTEDPADAKSFRSALPPRLAEIIHRCLEKDPERRYRGAASLARDLILLQEGIRGHPRLAHGVSRLAALMPAPGRWRKKALAAVAVATAVAIAWHWLETARHSFLGQPQTPEITALAVLPLANLSGDSEQSYLADGMTEALISELSKFGAFAVISRTTVMELAHTGRSLAEIARELGIEAVIEGSVLKSGDRVRITARLVHAESGLRLWNDSYERSTEDVLTLQNELARAIAREIRIALTPQRQQRLAALGAVSPVAAEAYLQGLSAEGWQEGEYFRQAIEEEPGFALAHAALAELYVDQGWHGWPYPPEEAFGRARRAADRALEIDPELSLGHAVQGAIAFLFDWRWDVAERELRRAVELDPGNLSAHSQLAFFLAAMGRFGEAVEEAERARELDPLSVGSNTRLCVVLYHARRFDRALELLHQRFDPTSPYVHWARWQLLKATGDPQATWARLIFEKVDQTPKPVVAGWEQALATHGAAGFWRAFLKDHLTTPAKLLWAVRVAEAYTLLGDHERALAWLETAYERRRPQLVVLGVDPIWDPLRPDPRFDDLLIRMQLPREVEHADR